MKFTEKKEGTFDSFDNTKLFYRAWPAKKATNTKKALIVLHRGHEHSGRLEEMINGIGLDDYMAFGYDARGHGNSPGPRGYAENFSDLVKDLDTFAKYISKTYDVKIENMFLVANSVGAVIASTWAHDYAPKIKGMILAAPAFEVKLYIPLAVPGLRILNAVKKPAFISSYVKSKFLTHDHEQAKIYDADPQITPQIAVNILLGLHDAGQRIAQDSGAINIPTLVLSAEKDWVVSNKIQKTFFNNLGTKIKQFVTLKGFFHGVLYEKNREKAFSLCHNFVKRCESKKELTLNLINADESGYTKSEYDTLLKRPIPLFREFSYWFQKLSLNTLGRLSHGIRVGIETGFDSGLSLDHVYKNTPKGYTFLGRMIDFFYINAIGWRGIRIRKSHIQNSLESVIEKYKKSGTPIKVMDIAGGPGRYLVEMAQHHSSDDFEVLVRDFEPKNIDAGNKMITELGVNNVSFERADAFDKKSYENLKFKPNVVVVSGLFELFPSNKQVMKAIEGITSVIEDGGTVIYTGQPWHPQLEQIAHTLPNRDGEKWIMRRRTQNELDQLFAHFGGVKHRQEIDEWGIFTVSTAEIKKKNTKNNIQRTSKKKQVA